MPPGLRCIQTVLTNSRLGAEYDYLHGPVLVRVTGNLSPSKAELRGGLG